MVNTLLVCSDVADFYVCLPVPNMERPPGSAGHHIAALHTENTPAQQNPLRKEGERKHTSHLYASSPTDECGTFAHEAADGRERIPQVYFSEAAARLQIPRTKRPVARGADL